MSRREIIWLGFLVLLAASALLVARLFSAEEKSILLIEAAANGQTADVCDLLAEGADDKARAPERGHQTALHLAANKEIAQLLIEHGADLDARDDKNHLPIHRAIERGNLEVVQALLDHGAPLPEDWNEIWPEKPNAALDQFLLAYEKEHPAQ